MRKENNAGEETISSKAIQSIYIGMPKVILTFGSGHPFDVVKTKMQANPYIRSGFLLSKDIFNKTGVRGFYTGGVPNFSRAILKEAYRTPLRGAIASSLNNSYPDLGQGVKSTIAGVSMALSDTIIICPLERLKVWMMTNRSENNQGMRYFFSQRTSQKPPLLQDMFKGLTVSMTRSSVSWVSYLLAESKIRETVINSELRTNKNNPSLSIPEKILVGGLGGIINGLCTLPFDTIKTNVQKEGALDKTSIRDMYEIGRNSVRSHGFLKGLYPGFLPRLIHYSIVGIITSDIISRVDKIWQPSSNASSKFN